MKGRLDSYPCQRGNAWTSRSSSLPTPPKRIFEDEDDDEYEDERNYDRGSRSTARMSDTIRGTSASFSLPYKSSNLPEGFTR